MELKGHGPVPQVTHSAATQGPSLHACGMSLEAHSGRATGWLWPFLVCHRHRSQQRKLKDSTKISPLLHFLLLFLLGHAPPLYTCLIMRTVYVALVREDKKLMISLGQRASKEGPRENDQKSSYACSRPLAQMSQHQDHHAPRNNPWALVFARTGSGGLRRCGHQTTILSKNSRLQTKMRLPLSFLSLPATPYLRSLSLSQLCSHLLLARVWFLSFA